MQREARGQGRRGDIQRKETVKPHLRVLVEERWAAPGRVGGGENPHREPPEVTAAEALRKAPCI